MKDLLSTEGRTQLSLGQQLWIQTGGQSLGKGPPLQPWHWTHPLRLPVPLPRLQARNRKAAKWGVGDERWAGQPWGRGRSSGAWSWIFLPLQRSCLLSGSSSSQFLGPTPLKAPILCLLSACCLPAACPLPAPGRPLPPHGWPGRPQRRY